MTNEDDPDSYLIESSVPDVRAFEQKTRNAIETQKKELRAMVGDKYQDLISAADTIVTMSRNAQAIQANLERMQSTYDVDSIKQIARNQLELQDGKSNHTIADTKRRYVYCIAALVKSLADVPEQIWRAMENHQYLHASRLFILAQQVHDYLEEEKQKAIIDIDLAFPVIQRQWDAVSTFKAQILQRSIHYLRISKQSTEHMAENMIGLMLLDNMSYRDVLEKFLEMRKNVIKDITERYTKGSDSIVHRSTHQLKEVAAVSKATVIQIADIFVQLEDDAQKSMIESYVTSFKQTFLTPSSTNHNNENFTSQSTVSRLFSPSSNTHLIMRFLPESIQQYLPQFDPLTMLSVEDVRQSVDGWVSDVERFLCHHLDQRLEIVEKHADLVQIRTNLWATLREDEMSKDKSNKWCRVNQSLLKSPCSIWNNLYRESFNRHTKRLIDASLQLLVDQPQSSVWSTLVDPKTFKPRKSLSATMHVWPDLSNKHQDLFDLPNLASADQIRLFETSLTETVHDRTHSLSVLQSEFDKALADITRDLQSYLLNGDSRDDECFNVKSDTRMIKEYFEDQCYEAVLSYSKEINTLLQRIAEWTDHAIANNASIFLGRLVRNIGLFSRELPKALSISNDTLPAFELRSRIDQNPKYSQAQKILTDTFHHSHDLWLDYIQKEYSQDLKTTLLSTKWNDQCPALLVWDNVEVDIKLPVQSTNAIAKGLYSVCEELQRFNSTMLDDVIMTNLRQKIQDVVNQVYETCIRQVELTENGALQLMFDYLFLCAILQQDVKLASNSVVQFLEAQIDLINWTSYKPHFKPSVNKFYIKQSLIFGVLTNANNETYERARKVISSQQQGQHNVLPLAPQAQRFTLLPIGHFASSIRTR